MTGNLWNEGREGQTGRSTEEYTTRKESRSVCLGRALRGSAFEAGGRLRAGAQPPGSARRGQLLECSRGFVLAHVVPVEAPPVHGHVDAVRKRLRERERAAEVEEAVRAAERVGHHRSGEHNRSMRQ